LRDYRPVVLNDNLNGRSVAFATARMQLSARGCEPDGAIHSRAAPFRSGRFILGAIEPVLRTRDEVAAGIRVRWELLHLLQLSVRSLEDSGTRVIAGQVAGLIALWTQLYTFEEDVPKALAWFAWAALVVSIVVLGVRIMPRRLSFFWQQLDFSSGMSAESFDEAEEERIIGELSTALRSQRDRLQRAVRTSIALGLTGLAVAAVAFAVDKGLYGG
jgi:hypothetical protein